jgi:hypothetical protein
MKIDPNQEVLNSVHPGKTTRSDSPGKDEFSAMLREAIDEPPTTIGGSEKMEMITSTSNIQPGPSLAVQNDPVIERTEKVLDILEEYQHKLLDPQSTLRDIHPLIEKMEMEQEALVPVLDSLPPGDGLKRILTDVLITSSVEVIRFNRGDYVTS